MTQTAIPCALMRGGSSKGLYFLASNLPSNPTERDAVLLRAMGGDSRQIDGMGGAHPLTSKVAIVSASSRDDADVDYLFAQIVVGENRVDTTPNCGNILSGIGAFAIATSLIQPTGNETTIRVHMINSASLCELVMQTPNGVITYEGDVKISGVPGTAAPVTCNFLDVAGSSCGALLPTGNQIDDIEGYAVTCIDNGMPVVVLRAADFGITGYENPNQLNTNESLRQNLEKVRLKAGRLMNLGDVTDKVVPKMSLVAAPRYDGHISTRTFIPHVCHASIGVLGAVSVASTCVMPGTIGFELSSHLTISNETLVCVEHPAGDFDINLGLDMTNPSAIYKAGLLRTTRMIFQGEVYIS